MAMSLTHAVMEGIREYGNSVGKFVVPALVIDGVIAGAEAAYDHVRSHFNPHYHGTHFLENMMKRRTLALASIGGLLVAGAPEDGLPQALEVVGQYAAVGASAAAVYVLASAAKRMRNSGAPAVAAPHGAAPAGPAAAPIAAPAPRMSLLDALRGTDRAKALAIGVTSLVAYLPTDILERVYHKF